MAKRTTTDTVTAVATVDPQETALATIPQDLLDAQGLGTDNINSNERKPPRLAICQTGSRQYKDTPQHITDIEEGDLFNTLSGVIYEKPLTFVVIQRLKTTYMQFDKKKLGNVLDYDVPEGDPRTLPKLGPKGEWLEKPIATRFDNYLVLLPDTFEVMALSFKSTGLKAARQLDDLIKYPLKIGQTLIPNPPAWARSFTLDTSVVEGNGNTWAAPQVTPAGITPEGMRLAARRIFEEYEKVQVIVDNVDEAPTAAVPDDDNIPF